MDYEKLKHISRIFDRVLTLPPERRTDYIDTLCGNDPVLKQKIEELLAIHDQSEELFEDHLLKNKELFRELDNQLEELSQEYDVFTGQTLGRWTLTELLGRGGMGSVYKAERTDDGGIRQACALKIIHKSLVTPLNIDRFKLEQQILAGLQHPNIAGFIDSGITPDGIPYMVMEYVEGVPLTDYCNKHCFSVEQRLGLFNTVCRAIQYAHKNLVVHRDLKPENILVTQDYHVKILDFGIAKLLDPDLYELSAVETQPGMRLMSLGYAAPEQVSGNKVTTATDIYALGILLYQLLTDLHPFDFEKQSYKKIEKIILENEPDRPSQKITQSADPDQLHSIAETRNARPDELIKQLKGDLDAIVQKTLNKDPERRYESAEALEADIDRHLKGLPIYARPDSVGYRGRKFVKRHRTGVITAVSIFLFFTGLAVLYTVQVTAERNRAEQAVVQAQLEAQKAEQVTSILIDLFEANNPSESAGKVITVEDILERGENQAKNLRDYPATQAQMFDVIGQIYHHLGQYDLSQKNLEEGYGLRKTLYGLHHPETVSSMDNLGFLRIEQGDYPEAENILRRALDIRERYLNPNHPGMAITLGRLAYAVRRQGNFDEAETLYRRGLQIHRDVFGEDHPLTIESLASLGITLHYKADYKETEKIFREVLERRRAVLGPIHGKTVLSINNLGALLMNTGHFDEAESLFREALDIKKELYGDEHPIVALTMNNLGITLRDQGLNTQASSFFKQALEMREKFLGQDHIDTAISKFSMARNMLETHRPDSALVLYQQALEVFREKLPVNHSFTARTLLAIGTTYLAIGNLATAEKYMNEGFKKIQEIHSDSSLEKALAEWDYAHLFIEKGDYNRASGFLNSAYSTLNEIEGASSLRQDKILNLLNTISIDDNINPR